MIQVTRLTDDTVIINSDLIEQIESTPDTMIALTNGHRMLVKETSDEIVDRIVHFRRRVLGATVSAPACGASHG